MRCAAGSTRYAWHRTPLGRMEPSRWLFFVYLCNRSIADGTGAWRAGGPNCRDHRRPKWRNSLIGCYASQHCLCVTGPPIIADGSLRGLVYEESSLRDVKRAMLLLWTGDKLLPLPDCILTTAFRSTMSHSTSLLPYSVSCFNPFPVQTSATFSFPLQ